MFVNILFLRNRQYIYIYIFIDGDIPLNLQKHKKTKNNDLQTFFIQSGTYWVELCIV